VDKHQVLEVTKRAVRSVPNAGEIWAYHIRVLVCLVYSSTDGNFMKGFRNIFIMQTSGKILTWNQWQVSLKWVDRNPIYDHSSTLCRCLQPCSGDGFGTG